MQRYVIVGSGPAGVSAAEAVRALDPNGEIVLVSEERHGYYSRPGLAYYLTGELTERSLSPFREADWLRNGAHLIDDRAVAISPSAGQVELQSGKRLAYDRLLLATGAQAIPLQAPGAGLEGVFKLDNLDDARALCGTCRKARTAVVAGGGITALELVEGLRARGVRVHYLMRQDRYWSNVLDETESHIVEERLRAEGVQIHPRTELAEIAGQRGHVAGIRTVDGRTIACDMVATAIGVRPRVELAAAAGLEIRRGVVVDDRMQTSAAGIYAAGDLSEVFDPSTGSSALDTLWSVARAEGQAAGTNMAGGESSYRRTAPLNVTRLAGITTTIIGTVGRGADADLAGIARGDSEVWRRMPDALASQSGFDANHLRLVIGPRTILGAVVMGDQTLSRPLQQLIAAEADISPVWDRLLEGGDSLASTIAEFWSRWRNTREVREG